ncbi:unnamed protein product [Didymodactylos carnosus]|uniref:RanBP2-type domain-containing protein n=1 Tax=Didymodactylos carnosus TaxID=1234261 RepID=A0A814DFU8_9BILA|nr:unnamed protein product [Didymodactylos carnosus]CAF3730069.1 unnamed protein product [Didymodactylos carnosus]
MLRAVYLSVNKFIQLSDILQEKNRIGGESKPKWQCKNKSCKMSNESGINICLHCYSNQAGKIVQGLSVIPVLGLPFSITHAVLETGRAAHTKECHDKVSAGTAIAFAGLDIALTPVFVGSLIKIPSIAAAKTGVALTSKTIFTQTGKVAATETIKKVTIASGGKMVGADFSDRLVKATKKPERKAET